MVKFKAKGSEIPVIYAAFRFDINSYYYTVLLKSLVAIPLFERVKMCGDSEQDLVVVAEAFEGNCMSYTLISQEQKKSLQLSSEPFQGEATVKTLLQNVGMPALMSTDTAKSWWMIKSCSLKRLIQELNDYAVVSNGGAPRFYLDLEGNLRYVDLKLSYEKKPVSLSGMVEKDNSSNEWMFQTPGVYDIIYSSVEGNSRERLTLDSNLLTGVIYLNDTSTKFKNVTIQAIKNQFYWDKYSSREITITNVHTTPHYPGQCVLINDEVKAVVSATLIPIIINNESISINVSALCPA